MSFSLTYPSVSKIRKLFDGHLGNHFIIEHHNLRLSASVVSVLMNENGISLNRKRFIVGKFGEFRDAIRDAGFPLFF